MNWPIPAAGEQMAQPESWALARIEGARRAANQPSFARPSVCRPKVVRPTAGIAPQSVIGSLGRLLEQR